MNKEKWTAKRVKQEYTKVFNEGKKELVKRNRQYKRIQQNCPHECIMEAIGFCSDCGAKIKPSLNISEGT